MERCESALLAKDLELVDNLVSYIHSQSVGSPIDLCLHSFKLTAVVASAGKALRVPRSQTR
jgi:hypothetical protein